MPTNDRLRIKRGDTARPWRSQCLSGNAPADLTGASARLLLQALEGTISMSLEMVVETGADGWARREWAEADTALAGTYRAEVEVTFANGAKQTFPGTGYATLEILPDLG